MKTSSVRQITPAHPAPEQLAQETIEVPPDRAVIAVRVEGRHSTFDAAAREVRAGIARINDRIDAQPHCTANVDDYSPPQRTDGDTWLASASLEVSIELEGVSDVYERMARLDACLGRLRTDEDAPPPKGRGKPGRELCIGDALMVVDHPQRYRAVLLQQIAERLTAAAGAHAPQWAPEDLRCTSSGIVEVRSRSLSALRVGLSVDAQIVRPNSPLAPDPE